MSVILESQVGDELICIEGFSASSEGVVPSWETSRAFRVGERVQFAGSYLDPQRADSPAGWMVQFDARDGRRYAANQAYFVTEDCWRGLQTDFVGRLLERPSDEAEDRLDVEAARAALEESDERIPYEEVRRRLGLIDGDGAIP